jgi:hypothetical protein
MIRPFCAIFNSREGIFSLNFSCLNNDELSASFMPPGNWEGQNSQRWRRPEVRKYSFVDSFLLFF